MKQIIFIFIILISFSASGQEKNAVWDYPVKPGSEEWKMTSYAEKVDKSQPPKELLSSWDTETLFKYCLDYPFNKVILLFNNPNDGFKRVYEQSSVWQEFIHRIDASDIYSKYVESLPYNLLFDIQDVEIRNSKLFTLFFLEKIVSETDFTDHLDSSSKRKLANTILQCHQSKKDYPNEFYGFPYNSSLSALLRILESDKVITLNDEISLAKFREKTENESFVDDNLDSAIVNKVINYINKQ